MTPAKSRPTNDPIDSDLVAPLTQLSLYVESELKQKVQHNGNSFTLTGIADYSLGYHDGVTMSGNLIVVEAKRRYHMSEAYGQLLSYGFVTLSTF